MKGFAKTVLETNDLAGQRELVAEYMEAEVGSLNNARLPNRIRLCRKAINFM